MLPIKMNPEQFNYYSNDNNSIQDYVHPMYTTSVDNPQYFDFKDDPMPFAGYQFADMHEVLNSDMYAAQRNSPPFMYYPSHPFQDTMHDARYAVDQPIGQPLLVHDSMRLLSMPEINIANSPCPVEFSVEKAMDCIMTHPPPKSRGRRASTRSETYDTTRHFMCSMKDCNKVFKRSEHLKRHVRSIHTLEKPFPCPTCGKTFSRTDNLNQHVRIHSRPKTKVSTIRSRQAHHPYTNGQLDALVNYMPFYSPPDHFSTAEIPTTQYPDQFHHPAMEPISFQ
ncbi:hypothetical protein DSO57_1003276 [Entomophthora muscae]|uniref:Uncharacterized protein n=1 Tax=Entomophthora muscae TaxID=34485 RepID=A0ACC2SL69_9FUNG|nr:hypothetical protein DSO57_1003276 [Entomophthora muscae]